MGRFGALKFLIDTYALEVSAAIAGCELPQLNSSYSHAIVEESLRKRLL